MKAIVLLTKSGKIVKKAHTADLYATVLDIHTRMGHADPQCSTEMFMSEFYEGNCPVIENDQGDLIEFIAEDDE